MDLITENSCVFFVSFYKNICYNASQYTTEIKQCESVRDKRKEIEIMY